ncbi:MAG: transcription termination/antitermination protein NusG [Paracoccaceae bacterium]
MSIHEFRIGDTLPPANPQRITSGPERPPVWHCLIVPAQRENAVRQYLRARDIYAFYPSQATTRHHCGRKLEIERPIISGHVYAQFRNQPQWHVLKARRIIRGIYCRGVTPVAIHPDIIRHLQGLTVEAERLAAARAEMLRVREGDTATIIAGPLAGLVVNVGQITGKEAWLNFPIGGRIKADIAALERVA